MCWLTLFLVPLVHFGVFSAVTFQVSTSGSGEGDEMGRCLGGGKEGDIDLPKPEIDSVRFPQKLSHARMSKIGGKDVVMAHFCLLYRCALGVP